jgi:hypothetical protein
MAGPEIKTSLIGNQEDRFPILENIWDFFSSKGSKTVFVSVGSGESPLPELDLSEMLGCPIHMFEARPSMQQKWEETKDILKSRKAKEDTSAFAKDALKKWVLPRNIRVEGTLPFSHEGELVVEGERVVTSSLRAKVEAISETLGFPKDQAHIDLLKIDAPGLEDLVLTATLKAMFRPSLIMIRWTHLPD